MKVILESSVKTLSWLVFVVLFVVYFVNADQVYYALSGKSYVVKLPNSFSLHAKGDLRMLAVFNYPPVNNKFEEGKGYRARFNMVANKSGKTKVRVFFSSSNALYEVIENRHSFWANPMKIAMNFFASTSGLENSIYKIGLYIIDDKGERFLWINNFFEKVAGGPVKYIAHPCTLMPTRTCKDLRFAIEEIYKDNEEFIFKGWVVLDNAEMNDYSAYITIKDSTDVSKTFYAPLFTRTDVASMYSDTRAANSGFQISVPQNEFVPGKYVIKVMIKSRQTGEVIESEQTETRNL